MVEVDMCKVVVPVRMVNQGDRYLAHTGHLPADQIRAVDIPDALVDTGATGLMVPSRFVKQPGLNAVRTRTATTVGGPTPITVYEPVLLTIQGRDCFVEVHEIGDKLPVLVGQVPLELLDWVVDCHGQRLVGNPAHDGEHMIDALSFYL